MPRPPTIADADPIAELLAWLQSHAGLLDVLVPIGAPDELQYISGVNEPPYPHIRVSSSPGGNDGDLQWLSVPEVLLETYGDPDQSMGPAALRKVHFTALAAAAEIRTRTHDIYTPVITEIRPSSAAVWSPMPQGQPRWVSALLVTIHPPLAVED